MPETFLWADGNSLPRVAENISGGTTIGHIWIYNHGSTFSIDELHVSDYRFELVYDPSFSHQTGSGPSPFPSGNVQVPLRLKAGQTLDYEAGAIIYFDIDASDGPDVLSERFAIRLTDVNEAPTAIALPSLTVEENSSEVIIGNVGITDPDANDTLTYTISDSRFEIVDDQLKLRSGQTLNPKTDSSLTVTITATDQGGLEGTQSFNISVTDVNEPPTLPELNSRSVEENNSGADVGTVSSMDPDANDILTYSVDDSRFEIVDNQLKLKAGESLDYEIDSPPTVTVTVTDKGGLKAEQSFDISIIDVNEAPIAPSVTSRSVEENSSGANVGTIGITDPDANDILTYTISDPRFEIVDDQLDLKAGETLNYEEEPELTVTVTATDSDELKATQTFDISTIDVNEVPTNIDLSSHDVEENNDDGAIVGTVSVTDPDTNDTHTFILSDPRFEIVGDQFKLKSGASLDHETESTLAVSVTATDKDGLELTQSFDINVTDVNEAPTAISLSSRTVKENSNGAIIGDIDITDPDTSDTHSYQVSDHRFEVVNGQLKLKDIDSLDYETEPEINLSITATDQKGLRTTELFDLFVTNQAEAPAAIYLSNQIVDENDPGAVVGSVQIVDLDANDTHLLSVSDSRFEIVGDQLKLKAGQFLEYQNGSIVTFSITATDKSLLSTTQEFTVDVRDLPSAPTAVTLSTTTVIENETGSVIGTLSVTDPDAIDTHTLSVSDSRFEIVGNQLQLKAGQYIDHEQDSTLTFTVTATDQSGLSTTEEITLTVTDINEVPTDIAVQNAVAALSDTLDTTRPVKVGDIVITDDALGTNQLQLLGADANHFKILNEGLYLKSGTVLDHQSKSQYEVILQVDDLTLGSTPDASVTYSLSVTDVNLAPTDLTLKNVVTTLPEAIDGQAPSRIRLADIDITDDNVGANTIQLSGADATVFEAIDNVLYLKAETPLDFEHQSQYDVTVSVDDAQVGSSPDAEASYSLSITNVNEAPSAIRLSNSDLTENQTGAVVGTLSVTDADANDTHTFSLSDERFEAVNNQIKLKAGESLNYETEPNLELTVTATDSSNLSKTETFTLTVNDANDTPSDLFLSANRLSINEMGMVVGALSAVDEDANATFSYTVNDPRFEVSGGFLKLTDDEAIPLDSPETISVEVTVTDQGQLSRTETFELEIDSQFTTWDQVFADLSSEDFNLSAAAEQQIRETFANGVNPIANVGLTVYLDRVQLDYLDTLQFDLGTAFADVTSVATDPFILELTETSIAFTEEADHIKTTFDTLLNGEALSLSMLDETYTISYDGTLDAGPLISNLVNRIDGVSMADDFQLGIRDFDIDIERLNGKLVDFKFNMAELLLSDPDIDIDGLFGDFGLSLPDWFEVSLPDLNLGLDVGLDSINFNFVDFNVGDLFNSLGFGLSTDFFSDIDLTIALSLNDLGELDFNFEIPSLPSINWQELGLDLPDFMADFFLNLDKFKAEFGKDFFRLTYLDNISTGETEELLKDFARDLGLDPSGINFPDINAGHPSILIKKNGDGIQRSLELPGVNSADTIQLFADLMGVELSSQLKNKLTNFTTLDLSFSIDNTAESTTKGVTIGYPRDIIIDLDSIPTLSSDIRFVDIAAGAISDAIKSEVFENQAPIFSDAQLTLQQSEEDGDESTELIFSGAVNGEPIELQFTGDDISLTYDFPDTDNFRPLAAAGIAALEAFVVDEIVLSSDTGFGIEGRIDFTANQDVFSEFIVDTIGLLELDFDLLLNAGSAKLDSTYTLDKELFDINGFSAVLKGAGFGLEVGSGQQAFSLDGKLALKGYDPTQNSEPELLLTGGLALDKSAITAGFLLDANSNRWNNPFGLTGASINQLGLQLGLTGSAIDNVGFLGNLAMPLGTGTLDAKAAFVADLTDPNKLAFDFTLNRSVKLLDLLSPSVLNLVAKSNREFKSFMEEVKTIFSFLNVEIDSLLDKDGERESLIRFVPFAGAEVLGKKLAQGMALNAKATLDQSTGWLSLKADSNFSSMTGSLRLPTINLAGIAILSGANDPFLDLKLIANSGGASLSGDGKLNILGTDIAKAAFEVTPTSVEIRDFGLNFFEMLSFKVDKLAIDMKGGTAAGTANLKVFGTDIAAVNVDIAPTSLKASATIDLFGLLSIENAAINVIIGTSPSATIKGAVKLLGISMANADITVGTGQLSVSGGVGFEIPGLGGLSTTFDLSLGGSLDRSSANVSFNAFGIGTSFTVTGSDLLNVTDLIGEKMLVDVVGAVVDTAINFVTDFASDVLDFVTDLPLVGSFFQSSFDFISGVVDFVVDFAQEIFDGISGLLSNGDSFQEGSDGNDFIDGKDGKDLIVGKGGDDHLVGGDGDDGLRGNAGNDYLEGSAGNEINAKNRGIHGGSGDDYLNGQDGNDYLKGESGNDRLLGGHGKDELHGGTGTDTVDYSFNGARVEILLEKKKAKTKDGNETLTSIENAVGSEKGDTIAGTNEENYLAGQGGNDTIDGHGGNDVIDGGEGFDTLYGGAGNDFFYGDDDNFHGGAGNDTVDFSKFSGPVAVAVDVDLNHGNFEFGGFTRRISSVENVIGTRYSDIIHGSNGDNILDGRFGNDVLEGRSGNDTLDGSGGNDTLKGGLGDDLLRGGSVEEYNNFYRKLKEERGPNVKSHIVEHLLTKYVGANVYEGGSGTDTVDFSYIPSFFSAQGNLEFVNLIEKESSHRKKITESLESIENIIGTQGGDEFTGDDADNILDGHRGNDTLNGGGGNDILKGGDGNDRLDGGDGDDYLNGNDGIDSFVGGNGTDTVDFSDTSVSIKSGGLKSGSVAFSKSHSETIEGVENLIGSKGSDTFTGDDSKNIIDGHIGNDTIQGYGGDDILSGGAGDDTLNGGSGDDILYGLEGKDNLSGGAGDDVLYARAGAQLTGGSGSDAFIVDFASFALNQSPSIVIKDFTDQDAIRFIGFNKAKSSLTFSANGISYNGSLLVTYSDHQSQGADYIRSFDDEQFSTSTESAPDWKHPALSKVSAKYIEGAAIFFDANLNGVQDEDEPFTFSNEEGTYSLGSDLLEKFDTNNNGQLDANEGQLMSQGGTDIYTGEIITTTFTAPADYNMITPVTTLVNILSQEGGDVEAAELQVKDALNLDEEMELSIFDPIAEMNVRNSDGADLMAHHVAIYTVIEQAANLIIGTLDTTDDTSTDVDAFAEQLRTSIAVVLTEQIKAGQSLDLTKAETVSAILQQSIANAASQIPSADWKTVRDMIPQIAQVMADGIQYTTDILTQGGANVEKLLQQVATVQTHLMKDTASDLLEVAAGEKDIAAVIAENSRAAIAQSTGVSANISRNLVGTLGDDKLKGTKRDDKLKGKSGDDIIRASRGDDYLLGTSGRSKGRGERDRLIGQRGQDTLVLGNAKTAYYKADGENDYALIQGFKPQHDVIVLHGKAADYVLNPIKLEKKRSGVGIFLEKRNELIGILQGKEMDQLTLAGNYFNFKSGSGN